MDRDFVQIVDDENTVHVVNKRHIVQVVQHAHSDWQVILTSGSSITVSRVEGEELLNHLPGAKPATAGPIRERVSYREMQDKSREGK